jgi:hypothetical protein
VVFESQYEILAKERVRELRESNSLLMFQFISPTTNEQDCLERVQEEEIDESEYDFLDDSSDTKIATEQSAKNLIPLIISQKDRKTSIEQLIED